MGRKIGLKEFAVKKLIVNFATKKQGCPKAENIPC